MNSFNKIIKEEYQFWNELLSDEKYDLLFKKHPRMKYGPFYKLRYQLNNFSTKDFNYAFQGEDSPIFMNRTPKINSFVENINILSISLEKIIEAEKGKELRKNKEFISRLSAFQELFINLNKVYNEYFLKYDEDVFSPIFAEKVNIYTPDVYLLSILCDISTIDSSIINYYDVNMNNNNNNNNNRVTYTTEELSLLSEAFYLHYNYLLLDKTELKEKDIEDSTNRKSIEIKKDFVSKAVLIYDKLKSYEMSANLLLETCEIKKSIKRFKLAKLYEKGAIVADEYHLNGYKDEAGELYTLAIQQSVLKKDLEHAICLIEKAGWLGYDIHINLLLKAGKIQETIDVLLEYNQFEKAIEVYEKNSGIIENAINLAANIALENISPYRAIEVYTKAKLIENAAKVALDNKLLEDAILFYCEAGKINIACMIARENYILGYLEQPLLKLWKFPKTSITINIFDHEIKELMDYRRVSEVAYITEIRDLIIGIYPEIKVLLF